MPGLATGLDRLRAERPTHFVRHPRANLIAIAIAGAVVAGSMLLASSGNVGAMERSVFEVINRLPNWLEAPMWVAQLFGALAFIVLVALAALILARTRLGVALLVAIPLKLAVEWWLVKALVERERPVITVPEAVIREVNSSPLGFPSGHAMLAFIMAGCLRQYVSKRTAVVLYLLAAMSGIARIYLGAHNPLDVIAGAAIGIAIAAGINLSLATPR